MRYWVNRAVAAADRRAMESSNIQWSGRRVSQKSQSDRTTADALSPGTGVHQPLPRSGSPPTTA